MASSLAVLATLAIASLPALADETERLSDLHGIEIGMTVSQLPPVGYRNLSCLSGFPHELHNWTDWMLCAAGSDGLRGIHIEYDQPGVDGTLVAGHAVDVSGFFDAGGRLVRIAIKTLDHTSLFMKKKARLLAHQATIYYGARGWNCHDGAPAAGEEAMASLFVNETCSKQTATRSILVTSHFFHKTGLAPRVFVSESTVVIEYRPQT